MTAQASSNLFSALQAERVEPQRSFNLLGKLFAALCAKYGLGKLDIDSSEVQAVLEFLPDDRSVEVWETMGPSYNEADHLMMRERFATLTVRYRGSCAFVFSAYRDYLEIFDWKLAEKIVAKIAQQRINAVDEKLSIQPYDLYRNNCSGPLLDDDGKMKAGLWRLMMIEEPRQGAGASVMVMERIEGNFMPQVHTLHMRWRAEAEAFLKWYEDQPKNRNGAIEGGFITNEGTRKLLGGASSIHTEDLDS